MLNYLYENQPKLFDFIPRKITIKSGKNLVFGSPLSGKTTLGLNWIKNYTNSFYINASDLRYNIDYPALCEFVRQKNIEAICIDDITKEPLILPKIQNILLLSNQKSLEINDFNKARVFGLDFEEFIAFSKSGANFSQFMSVGNSLPQNSDLLRYAVRAKISSLAAKILSSKSLYESPYFNALGIFRELKESLKLSKDALYKEISELSELGVIAFAASFEPNSRLKKMYFCDFALRKLFTLSKNPRKIIENMVFCELAKTAKEVYFKGDFDFYLPKSKAGILILPFLAAELAILKAKKLANDEIKEIIIISNATEQSIKHNSTALRLMSFATFAAGYLDE